MPWFYLPPHKMARRMKKHFPWHHQWTLEGQKRISAVRKYLSFGFESSSGFKPLRWIVSANREWTRSALHRKIAHHSPRYTCVRSYGAGQSRKETVMPSRNRLPVVCMRSNPLFLLTLRRIGLNIIRFIVCLRPNVLWFMWPVHVCVYACTYVHIRPPTSAFFILIIPQGTNKKNERVPFLCHVPQ